MAATSHVQEAEGMGRWSHSHVSHPCRTAGDAQAGVLYDQFLLYVAYLGSLLSDRKATPRALLNLLTSLLFA